MGKRRGLPKIIIVAEELDCVGGVQKFVDLLARGLSVREYDVELVGLHESATKFPYDRSSLHGVRYLKPDMSKIRETLASNTATEPEKSLARKHSMEISALAAAELSMYLGSLSPSTIIIAVQIGALSALVSSGALGRGGPTVISQFHGSFDYATKQHYFAKILELFPLTRQSLFLTAADARQFSLAGVRNAGVMPNFFTRPIGANPHFVPREQVVVSLSRYAPEKSLHELVEAWAMLHDDFPDWQLKLYGDGPEAPRIAARIEELGVTASVSLQGSVADAAPVLELASVHAMTSHQEGFPMALMEASAMKVPSVVFWAGPSTTELIEHGTSGFVVDSPSVGSFAEYLSTLMADSSLRTSFGDRAFDLSKRFSADTILDSWEDLFRRIA